jgi:hypothetical protein
MKALSIILSYLLRFIGWVLLILGTWLCLLALLDFNNVWIGENASDFNFFEKCLRSMIVIGVVLILYFLIVKSSRKLIQFSRQIELKEEIIDTIPEGDFVVYLRSFKEDDTFDVGSEELSRSNLYGKLFFGLRSTEEQLIGILNKVGKVVCIGDPREKLPLLGANRMYFREEGNRWQTEIVEMMKKSKLIVMRGGTTASLGWELEQVIKHDFRDKFICLLIDRKGADYSVFEKLLEEKIQHPNSICEPQITLTWWQKFNGGSKFFGKIFYFESNWKPITTNIVKAIEFKFILRNKISRPAELPLSLALTPAFHYLKLPLKLPSYWWFWMVCIGLLGALLSYSFYTLVIMK